MQEDTRPLRLLGSPLNYVTVSIGNITSSDYSIDAADVVVFQPTVGLNHLSVFRSLFLLPPLDVTQVLLLKACLSLAFLALRVCLR